MVPETLGTVVTGSSDSRHRPHNQNRHEADSDSDDEDGFSSKHFPPPLAMLVCLKNVLFGPLSVVFIFFASFMMAISSVIITTQLMLSFYPPGHVDETGAPIGPPGLLFLLTLISILGLQISIFCRCMRAFRRQTTLATPPLSSGVVVVQSFPSPTPPLLSRRDANFQARLRIRPHRYLQRMSQFFGGIMSNIQNMGRGQGASPMGYNALSGQEDMEGSTHPSVGVSMATFPMTPNQPMVIITPPAPANYSPTPVFVVPANYNTADINPHLNFKDIRCGQPLHRPILWHLCDAKPLLGSPAGGSALMTQVPYTVRCNPYTEPPSCAPS